MPHQRPHCPFAPPREKTWWVLKSAKMAWPSFREVISTEFFTKKRKDWPVLLSLALTTPLAVLMLVIWQQGSPGLAVSLCVLPCIALAAKQLRQCTSTTKAQRRSAPSSTGAKERVWRLPDTSQRRHPEH